MSSADILKADFLRFLWYVWKFVLELPPPDRLQLDIGRYLAEGPPSRFIQAYRGVGKSFLTCAYVVWRLWKNPQLKILIVSANEDLAVENATLIKQIIDHPAGEEFWKELRSKGNQRTSTMAFDVGPAVPDKSPSVKTVGITGQLTGSRSDILISDDVEVPKNSQTETQRDKLRHLIGEYGDIAKPDSEIIYLGTPQSFESIYKGLREQDYDIRVWPGRYPLRDKLHHYDGTLAPILLKEIEENPDLMKPVGSTVGGAPTNPIRFNELVLQGKELKRGSAGFLLQYQLDTTLTDAERYPLKTRDLIVTDVDKRLAPIRLVWGQDPEKVHKDLANVGFDGDRMYRPLFASNEFVPFTGSALHIDPSGRGKDRTAYVVTKFLNGWVYIRRWGGFQEGFSPETLRALAEIARDEEVNHIGVEDNFGDGMFTALLEPVVARVYPVTVEGYKVTGMKEQRMMALVRPALQQHRLVLDTTAARADLANPSNIHRGLYQLTHLTEQKGALKHDDLIDVLAQALEYWAPYMNADANKAEESWQRKQDEAFEREFFKGTIFGDRLAQKGRGRAVGRPTGRVTRRKSWGDA
jgi:hypothetical protein